VAPLFIRLVDDAALYPPGNVPLPMAVPSYFGYRYAPYGEYVGRFCCPASRLPELVAEPPAEPPAGVPLEVALVADTGLAGLTEALSTVEGEPGLRLGAVEVALPGEDLVAAARRTVAGLPPGLPSFVEVPRAPGWEGALDVLAGAGGRAQVGAKLRTGGPTAGAFPPVAELAAFLLACTERELAFKCTAGLHHAVRHRDRELDVDQHGFLNVLLATHAALSGGDVADVLSTSDGRQLAEGCWQVSAADATRLRAAFRSFGTCSVVEPMADLAALGLL
jgi:hypothetical protein